MEPASCVSKCSIISAVGGGGVWLVRIRLEVYEAKSQQCRRLTTNMQAVGGMTTGIVFLQEPAIELEQVRSSNALQTTGSLSRLPCKAADGPYRSDDDGNNEGQARK